MRNCLIFSIILLLQLTWLISCTESKTMKQLALADEKMETAPDSALLIINEIDSSSLSKNEDRARYALLKTIALDKNYIDTTTFDILQPAIDYYLDNGTADEKLRTYYYQGRIFMNQGDNSSAMRSFVNAREFIEDAIDTLTVARLLVAQGSLFTTYYRSEDYVANNLYAAELFRKTKHFDAEYRCLKRVLAGCILEDEETLADSVIRVCNEYVSLHPELQNDMIPLTLSYIICFGSHDEIRVMLDEVTTNMDYIPDEMRIDVANGYLAIGEGEMSLAWIETVDTASITATSLKYLASKPWIMEVNKDLEGALDAYKRYYSVIETMHNELFTQDLLFAQERHELEKVAIEESTAKAKVIWVGVCVALVLLIVVLLLQYRYRLSKARGILAEKERDNLHKEKENLELAKHNAELELEKQTLTTENLRLRISQLEAEDERLKELLHTQTELSKPVEEAIRERIGLLNGLLAKEITENDIYARPYDEWLDSMLKDKDRFMDSTRLAFKASHPRFMDYIESCGLSEFEINYLCLYAIGLRGKEVGEYINLKRHYNISSEIRKKLGIDEHETNIGLYVRRLMKEL